MNLGALAFDDLSGPGLGGLDGASRAADAFEEMVDAVLFGELDAEFA